MRAGLCNVQNKEERKGKQKVESCKAIADNEVLENRLSLFSYLGLIWI